jgi:hypothetical protein
MHVKCFKPSSELSLSERMNLNLAEDLPILLVGCKHYGNVSSEAHNELVKLLIEQRRKENLL